MSSACRLKLPRCTYKNSGHITAMLDQSDGNDTRQISTIAAILTASGTLGLRWIAISTTAHASDHMTLVWLKTPVDSGKNGMPNAKS